LKVVMILAFIAWVSAVGGALFASLPINPY